MNEKLLEAMERVVEHDWDQEYEDYRVKGCPEGHVFESLRTLNDYLVASGDHLLDLPPMGRTTL